MFKTIPHTKEQLDRLGKLVLHAASDNEEAVATAADAPFLYTKVRASIAEEQRRRDDAGGWLSVFLIARRAVPAMGLVTLLTLIPTLLFINSGSSTQAARFDEDAIFDTSGTSLPGAILANTEGLTRDEVFSIVVDRNDRRSTK